MLDFNLLEKKSPFLLKEVDREKFIKEVPFIVVDEDSPIGANDTMAVYVCLHNGEVTFVGY